MPFVPHLRIQSAALSAHPLSEPGRPRGRASQYTRTFPARPWRHFLPEPIRRWRCSHCLRQMYGAQLRRRPPPLLAFVVVS